MLGDTISITVNAVAKTLSKINQDGYSAEYLLRESTGEYRLKVRHQKDRPDKLGRVYDRHTADFTYTIFPDSQGLGGKTRRTYIVIVNKDDDDAASVVHIQQGLQAYLNTANATKVVGWES